METPNYQNLQELRHYDYFFWPDGKIKTAEYLGGFAGAILKVARAYVDAYGRADESNQYAMQTAFGDLWQVQQDVHRYLLFCYNKVPSAHMPALVAFLFLGYHVNALLQMLTEPISEEAE